MVEGAAAKKRVYLWTALGVAGVIALVVAVRTVLPDFPSTSTASVAFFGALALVAVAYLVAAVAQILMKRPAGMPVTPWTFALVVSRMSFAWAMFLLAAVAVIGSMANHLLARPLFHTLVVEVMLGAFWFMATSTVAIVTLFRSRAD